MGDIDAATEHGVEERVDFRAILVAKAREGGGGIDLSRHEGRHVRDDSFLVWPAPRRGRLAERVGDRRSGSVDTRRTGPAPASAAAMARAQATVVLPTPPFPPTMVSVRVSRWASSFKAKLRSESLKTRFSTTLDP